MSDKQVRGCGPMALKPFLALPELAERWGVSARSVRRLIDAGQIEPTRFGRSVRIAATEVQRFEAQNRL
jgi:excisionase family DNA binding protein